MKNLLFWGLFAITWFSIGIADAESVKKYVVNDCNNIQVRHNNQWVDGMANMDVSDSDTVRFGDQSFLILYDKETKKVYPILRYAKYTTFTVKQLLKEGMKICQANSHPLFERLMASLYGKQDKKRGRGGTVTKDMEVSNDTLLIIPEQIYQFVKTQKLETEGIASSIACQLDIDKKNCFVRNDSDKDLFIDVICYTDDQTNFISIFSSLREWMSTLFVPCHEERTFWFTNDFVSVKNFLFVGSEISLPLNELFRQYHPNDELLTTNLNVELVMKRIP